MPLSHNLAAILTQEISVMKGSQGVEVVPYDRVIKDGLKAVEGIGANLVKLVFSEYEPLNMICNVLQVPQIYISS